MQVFVLTLDWWDVQSTGAEGFILDLRNNPGGLVRSGLDIARLWMDGEAAIFNVQGREDNGHIAIMQVRFLRPATFACYHMRTCFGAMLCLGVLAWNISGYTPMLRCS